MSLGLDSLVVLVAVAYGIYILNSPITKASVFTGSSLYWAAVTYGVSAILFVVNVLTVVIGLVRKHRYAKRLAICLGVSFVLWFVLVASSEIYVDHVLKQQGRSLQ
ncbi:hypothetical protein [Burkholderia contaminans]|uniref:hypothetical protein n=1 Tax=Burkholderia contaminans TaxID=488447 RepID=UPI001CF1266B|nr:hypothetical protein [Burkholderia contaminans]